MRILHTADWHLGHTLRDHDRGGEHAAFLRWLLATIAEREVDALLIAGDVFDAANPPPAALRAWFDFLGAAKRSRPALQVVVIAGNHDSGARLAAPTGLLTAFDVHVVGHLPRDAQGRLRADELLVPLRDAVGRTGAVCAAIPFLRATDVLDCGRAAGPAMPTAPAAAGDVVLPRAHEAPEAATDLIGGIRALHDAVFAAARARLQPGQALVALAHGYLVGGMLSELSERKVLGGNQHALPVDLFPDDCAYVALGHLHRPQPIAGRDHIRYSGSPLPLAMPERVHAHHVVFADLQDGRLQKTWSLRVPRSVQLLRIPEHGELAPAAALAAIAELPAASAPGAVDERPFLEVAVRLAEPAPGIAERIAAAAQLRAVRLVRVEIVRAGSGNGLEAGELPALDRLTPEQVFVRRYRKDHEGEPPPALLAAFRELLEGVEHEGTA